MTHDPTIRFHISFAEERFLRKEAKRLETTPSNLAKVYLRDTLLYIPNLRECNSKFSLDNLENLLAKWNFVKNENNWYSVNVFNWIFYLYEIDDQVYLETSVGSKELVDNSRNLNQILRRRLGLLLDSNI